MLKGTARLALVFALLFAAGLARAGSAYGGRPRDGVASLRADRVTVRFRRPFPVAAGMWNAREAWILRLADADGRVGVGEAVVEPDDGEVAATVLESLVREAVAMAGERPAADRRRAGGPRAAGPGAAGGARRRAVRPRGRSGPDLRADGDGVGVNATIPLLGPAASAEAARQAVAAGFTTLKLKGGAERETEVLVDRVRAVREAIGPDVRLRLDVNGAWDPRPPRTGSRRWPGSTSSTWSSRWPATTPRRWPSSDAASGCRSPPTRPSRREGGA